MKVLNEAVGVHLLLLKLFANLSLWEVKGFEFLSWVSAELEQDRESFVTAWVSSGMTCFDADLLGFGFLVRSKLGPAASVPRQLELEEGTCADTGDFSVSAKPTSSPKRGREAFPPVICIAL